MDLARIAEALPDYDVGELLGTGAFGAVYAVVHRELDRPGAVKTLNLSAAGGLDKARERFRREARVLAQLGSPHVVAVHDFRTHGDDGYLVMERCAGSAEDVFTADKGDDRIGLAGLVAVSTLCGLDAAHSRGLVHRDIKPANVLIGAQGRLKVADFGIVYDLTDASATQGSAGTFQYMSPEQCVGTEISPASDIYSVAAMFYALVTGDSVFPHLTSANQYGWLTHHVEVEPAPLADVAGVPRSLSDVVARGLAKSPSDRFASAEQFALAMANALTAGLGSGWIRNDRHALLWPAVTDAIGRAGPSAARGPSDGSANLPPVTPGPPAHDTTPRPDNPVAGLPTDTRPVAAPAAAPGKPSSKLRAAVIGVAVLVAAVIAAVALRPGGSDDNTTSDAPVAIAAPTATTSAATTGPEPDAPAASESATLATPGPTTPPPAAAGPGEVVVAVGDDLAAAVANAPDDSLIRLAPGNHTIDAFIGIDRPLTIRGASRDTTTVTVTNQSQVFALAQVAVTISDLTVTSTDSSLAGNPELGFSLIELFNTAPGTLISNVAAVNGYGSGMLIGGDSQVTVVNSIATGNAGFGFLAREQAAPTFISNTATQNLEAGFVWLDASHGTAVANSANDNQAIGYSLQNTSAPTLTGNTATNNGEVGFVWFDNAVGAAIANRSSSNNTHGFSVQGSGAPTLTTNTAVDNQESGYVWFDTTGGAAIGNFAGQNNRDGIFLTGEATPALVNNISDGYMATGSAKPARVNEVTIIELGDDLASVVADAPSGAVLRLRPGTHTVTEPIVIDRPMTLRGDPTATTSISVATGTQALVFARAAITIADLTVTTEATSSPAGSANLPSLIELVDTEPGTLISNVVATNGLGDGFLIAGTSKATVVNSQATGNAGAGFIVMQAAAPALIANLATGNSREGFIWLDSSTGDVSANTAEANGNHGYSISVRATPTLHSNSAVSNTGAGFVWFEKSSGSGIANSALDNGRHGFVAAGESTPMLHANLARGNQEGGLLIEPDAVPEIRHNNIDQ